MILFALLFLITINTAFTREIPEKRFDGKKLVIDHDGGADDAMAIFIALLNEEYFNGPQLVGLTTVHGNVYENQAFFNTQRILGFADRQDVPIFRGNGKPLIHEYPQDNFFGTDGLGDNETVEFETIKAQEQHAVLALIDLSKEYKGDLIVLTIGSLTNIAMAIRLDPEFLSRLSHIYVAAGNIVGDGFEKGEFNALMDVEAYRIVSDSAVLDKFTMIPYSEIVKYSSIEMSWRTDVFGVIDTEIIRALNTFEQVAKSKVQAWALLDPLAMAVVLNDLVVEESVPSENSIILCDENRGLNTNTINSTKSNVNLITRISKEKIKSYLLEIFSADLD